MRKDKKIIEEKWQKILTYGNRYGMLNKHRQMEEVFFLCLNLT